MTTDNAATERTHVAVGKGRFDHIAIMKDGKPVGTKCGAEKRGGEITVLGTYPSTTIPTRHRCR